MDGVDPLAAADTTSSKQDWMMRSTFPWVLYMDSKRPMLDKEAYLGTIHQTTIAQLYGVPEPVFVNYLRKEQQESESCWSLPFTLAMVVSYAGMMITHRGSPNVMSAEMAVEYNIEENANFAFFSGEMGFKTMYDVNSVPDFWSWVNMGVVPLFLPQELAWSENRSASEMILLRDRLIRDSLASPEPRIADNVTGKFPVYERGRNQVYSRIVGGIRFRQERSSKEQRCETNVQLDTFYGRECVGGERYELEPDTLTARSTSDAQRARWLYVYEDLSVMYQKLADMERTEWLDERTQKIEISLPLYNGEIKLFSLIHMNFYFSRGGRIWKRIIAGSVFEEMYEFSRATVYVFDFVWAACLLWIAVTEGMEIRSTVKVYGVKGIWTQYVGKFGIWNCVDWISVIWGVVIVLIFLNELGQVYLMGSVMQDMQDIDPARDKEKFGDLARDFLDKLNTAVDVDYGARIVFAVYPMVISLRLLKAFSSQPRLSLLTRTLWLAKGDLSHFLLVFGSVFMTYAVAGVVLFGRAAEDFLTIDRAIMSCFRASMGSFEWEEMVEVGRMEASAWFVSFMIIISTVMLNIVLAIVMEAYGEVSRKLGKTDTLWSEAKQTYERWRGQSVGELVALSEVLSHVRTHRKHLPLVVACDPSNWADDSPEIALTPVLNSEFELRMVTISYLRTYVMTMRSKQAQELIEDSVVYYYQQNELEVDMEQMFLMVREMDFDTRSMLHQVRRAVDAQPGESSDEDVRGVPTDQKSLEYEKADFLELLGQCEKDLRMAELFIGLEDLDEEAKGPELMEPEAPEENGDVDEDGDEAEAALQSKSQELSKRVQELEEELVRGRQTVAEAVGAVTELETRLLRASEDAADASARLHHLRRQVTSLAEQRRQARYDAERGVERATAAKESRDECFEVAQDLIKENRECKAKLDDYEKRRSDAERRVLERTEALDKADRTIRKRISEARLEANSAEGEWFMMQNELHKHLEQLERVAIESRILEDVEDYAGLARLIHSAREMLQPEPHADASGTGPDMETK